MVHYSKVSRAINRYIKDEILPKLEVGSIKHLMMFAIGSAINKKVQTLAVLLDSIPMFKFAQIVNGENIDADLAIEILREYMQEFDHFSIKIPTLTPGSETVLTLRGTDVDMLDKYINT